jgi:hypothetical protein
MLTPCTAVFRFAFFILLAFVSSHGLALDAQASITGICPDGSVFIVQDASTIPCRNAKAVDPSDVPPLRPEYLPRRYEWERFARRQDPNNPYNLIRTRRSQGPDFENAFAPPTEWQEPQQQARTAPQAVSPSATARGGASTLPIISLDDTEAQDLAMIVDLRQQSAPALIRDRGFQARLQIARSAAFEERMLGHLAAQGAAREGQVVLFTADGESGGAFYGNLTFVQGGIAFHPDQTDTSQLGVIRGQLGEIPDGSRVLGYVVLPERLDLRAPIDIYWNDLVATATLQP